MHTHTPTHTYTHTHTHTHTQWNVTQAHKEKTSAMYKNMNGHGGYYAKCG